LAYFVNHGLNFGGSRYLNKLTITWDVVAQAFDILAKRVKKINRVMTLQEEATFKVFQLCPLPRQIRQLPLPPAIQERLEDVYPYLTDIIDRDLWRTRQQTVFSFAGFPRYLLRHVNKEINVRSAHYMFGLHDFDWHYNAR
jgi:hypothetical protein